MYCKYFVLEYHEGECPALRDDEAGICVEECEGDQDCRREEKCCSNGCGHTCQRADREGMEESMTMMMITYEPETSRSENIIDVLFETSIFS